MRIRVSLLPVFSFLAILASLPGCASIATFSPAAYEYAKGRPKNEFSARQWEIMKDPNRNLLGGFIKRWEERSTLPVPFIDEAKGLVSDAFDAIIGLGSGKIRPSGQKTANFR